MDADTKKQLNRYVNQIGLLNDEIAQLQHDQSLRDWEVKELDKKNSDLSRKIETLVKDLTYEKGRASAIEEECLILSHQLQQANKMKDSIAGELALLKREERVISSRIQESYRKLSERRKLSKSLSDVPFNNSDVEDYEEDTPLRLSSHVQDRSIFDQIGEHAEWKENPSWLGDSSVEYLTDGSSEDIEGFQCLDGDNATNFSTANTSLLSQYEQLISELQRENQKLLDLNYKLKQQLRTPKSLAFFSVRRWSFSSLRPLHAVLWQHWSLNLDTSKTDAVQAILQVD